MRRVRVLNAHEAADASRRLANEVPLRVLLAVAQGDGKRVTQITDEVLGRLPSSVVPEDGPGWISDVLEWFVGRGDVERGRGGRFRCVPPHVVEGASESRPRLYGDPKVEGRLGRALRAHGARVNRELFRPARESTAYPAEDGERLPVGVERRLSEQDGEPARLLAICEASGVTTIRFERLTASLPRLSSVTAPAAADLSPVEIRTGLWEAYDTAGEGERWRKSEYWRTGQSRLIRWRASEDWSGERNARLFYHAGQGRVAELGAEAANLWQLYLDAEAGRSRAVWRDGRDLWVPRIAPASTQRWLEILSGQPRRLVWRWVVLRMDGGAASEARSVLTETVGLRCCEGRPPYEGPKTYLRGRRRG